MVIITIMTLLVIKLKTVKRNHYNGNGAITTNNENKQTKKISKEIMIIMIVALTSPAHVLCLSFPPLHISCTSAPVLRS